MEHMQLILMSILILELIGYIALHVNNKTVTYFDSFEIEHISKEVKKSINNRNIIGNIFRIQAYDSVMCGYFCIGFISKKIYG